MVSIHQRTESLREFARRLGVRRFWKRPRPPVNWRPRDGSDINWQVDYAMTGGAHYRNRLVALGVDLSRARVLEIGPGVAFGAMAYLRACGAEVTVADRWLAPWQDDYHGPLYAALADRLETSDATFDVATLRAMVAAKGYIPGTITCLRESAENLASVRDGDFQALLSNAVLEHAEFPVRAFSEFYRVTAVGGVGVHQVDFRDHRDTTRPLEHLLFRQKVFAEMSRRVHAEYGSQLRQADYASLLKSAGFAIEGYESNEAADPAYLDDFMARFVRRRGSRYASMSREELADLGGVFLLRRT